MDALNCPFCGSPPRIPGGSVLVTCSNTSCSMAGKYISIPEWNNRVGDNHKEAFRQFAESTKVLMAENELLRKNALTVPAQKLLERCIRFRRIPGNSWVAGTISQTHADLLNEIGDLCMEYYKSING